METYILSKYGPFTVLGERSREVRVILTKNKLGAGSALPSTYLMSTILNSFRSADMQHNSEMFVTITLCDYNPDVLSHASIPNLLLAFASQHADLQPFPTDDTLEIPASLKTAFTTDLVSANMTVNGVGGAWGKEFCKLVEDAQERKSDAWSEAKQERRAGYRLILASETLYSPKTLPVFTNTLLALLEPSMLPTGPWPESLPALRDAKNSSTALVASKKVYFGVGGGVDEFLVLLEKAGGWARIVWDSDWEGGEGIGRSGGGVGRCILEVGKKL